MTFKSMLPWHLLAKKLVQARASEVRFWHFFMDSLGAPALEVEVREVGAPCACRLRRARGRGLPCRSHQRPAVEYIVPAAAMIVSASCWVSPWPCRSCQRPVVGVHGASARWAIHGHQLQTVYVAPACAECWGKQHNNGQRPAGIERVRKLSRAVFTWLS